MIFVFQGVTRTRRSDDTGDFCTFEISPVQIVGFIRVVSIFSRFRPYRIWILCGWFWRIWDFTRTRHRNCTGVFWILKFHTYRTKNTAEFSWKDNGAYSPTAYSPHPHFRHLAGCKNQIMSIHAQSIEFQTKNESKMGSTFWFFIYMPQAEHQPMKICLRQMGWSYMSSFHRKLDTIIISRSKSMTNLFLRFAWGSA